MGLQDEIQESQENLVDQFSEYIQDFYDWEAEAQEAFLAAIHGEEETEDDKNES